MRLLTFSVFAALLSAPAFAADLGTYRPGTPYSSAVAGGADVCDSQCAGDAQCRGWNYVKPNPRAAGVCEFLSTVSTPISSQISISGESQSAAPYYSGLTSGGTNTVRVGTQTSSNTTRVGQSPSGRRIVRQPVPQHVVTQQASTQPVENMSLTAQQNRYRQGHVGAGQPNPQAARQVQGQRLFPGQRPMFRPILDGPPTQNRGQQFRQPQAQSDRRQNPRRTTGPRRFQSQAPIQGQALGQGTPAPQFQDPRMQMPQHSAPHPYGQAPQPVRQAQAPQQRGQSRPPIGQPIPTPQSAARPQSPAKPMTPSQRLAQFTAQTQTPAVSTTGPVALTPQQARTSLFGKLNDDLGMPTVSAVPTQPVSEQPLGEILAGGR